jgi:MFS family permease
MLFFWTLFDGSVLYTAPLAMTQAGFSKTMMGLIIGSSSIFGGLFDLVMSKFIRHTHFRRVYLAMFILAFLYPLILWGAQTTWMFLLAMAIWGFYFDLMNFGTFDFVGRKAEPKYHSAYFGQISIFRGLGNLLAPLFVGIVLGASTLVDWKVIALMGVFLSIGFSFYLLLLFFTNREKREFMTTRVHKKINLLLEIRLWRDIGKKLFPLLLITLFWNMFDSFFWTLGPLVAESYESLHPFNGLFLTAHTLPMLLAGSLVGNVTNRFGKKKTAIVSFFIGSMIMSSFFFFNSPAPELVVVFLASFFAGMTVPALNGTFADYLSETPRVEKEVEAVSDFFANLGYVIGPITAGLLADLVGESLTFSLLGVIGALVAFVVYFVIPKKINLKKI